MAQRSKYWKKERKAWDNGNQQRCLDDFGDVAVETEGGMHFIHAPTQAEIEADLGNAGFTVEGAFFCSQIASEKPHVREFSDECRFWIARREG